MAQAGKKLKKCCYIQPAVRESMRPKSKYERSTLPFDDETVHRASYLPIGRELAQQCRLDSMRPMSNLDLNTNLKMDTDTIHNLSYMPLKVKPKVTPPWAVRAGFVRPNIPMDLNTIYGNSYLLPGTFKECDEDAKEPQIVIYAEECDDIDGLIRVP